MNRTSRFLSLFRTRPVDHALDITEQGQKAPDLQSGDEWPPPLPVAHLPGRIATYGSAERAQDLQVQTPAHCRAGRDVGVYLAPVSGTLQCGAARAPRRLADARG